MNLVKPRSLRSRGSAQRDAAEEKAPAGSSSKNLGRPLGNGMTDSGRMEQVVPEETEEHTGAVENKEAEVGPSSQETMDTSVELATDGNAALSSPEMVETVEEDRLIEPSSAPSNTYGLSGDTVVDDEDEHYISISPEARQDEHETSDLPSEQPQPATSTTSEPVLPTTTNSTNNDQANRFPPPGTLVVVQGVVHTTDVPRPAVENPVIPNSASDSASHTRSRNDIRRASSLPRPSTPASAASSERSGPRNRLSQLLRARPASLVNPTQHRLSVSSSNNSLQPRHSESSFTRSSDHTRESLSASPSSSNETDEAVSSPSSSTPTPQAQTEAQVLPQTQISSSSIDVLGTLLR
jgi:hypothetical protein